MKEKSQVLPSVFIGSSREGIRLAEALQIELVHTCFPQTWFNLFGNNPGISNLEQLRQFQRFDFAIMLLTKDDLITSRDVQQNAPRDNLIFELGLFMGSMGPERAMFVVPSGSDIKIPSDLFGIAYLQYYNESAVAAHSPLAAVRAAMSPAAAVIKDRVRSLGSRDIHPIGATSGIRFNPVIRFVEDRLRFLMGYLSDGILYNARAHLYFVYHHEYETGRLRRWVELPLDKSFMPEVQYTWHLKYDLSTGSIPGDPRTLKELRRAKGVFFLAVEGTDLSGTNRRNRHVFSPDDIRIGNFPQVVIFSDKIFDEERAVDWSIFMEFYEAETAG